MPPQTRYARSGEVGIAYQVFGEGELDLVLAFPFLSHLDLIWENPLLSRFLHRLGSFARTIVFDRRGVGLSDPVPRPATLEERMDDVRAVMDAAGSERSPPPIRSEPRPSCFGERWRARPPTPTIPGRRRGRRCRRPRTS
jgi:pimeloyl-ACP methyl ester carboxylesterase